MALQFTPAAQRALKAASHWINPDKPDGIGLPELLLGLLAETECRAAAMLAARGVDAAAVRERWPELGFSEQAGPNWCDEFSAPTEAALDAVSTRLIDYPPPLVFATEHLLLAVVASEHEAAAWLAERGFTADGLEAEIHRLAGYEFGPLAFDAEANASAAKVEPAILPLPKGEGQGEGEAALASASQSVTGKSSAAAPPLPKGEGTALLRIIDAAANRAREGLRVLEDFARFALDDGELTDQFKQARHALAIELARFDASALLAARDTPADVGTQLTAEAERRRPDLGSVLTANFKRVQEALRSLEEFGKTLDADFGAAMKQLRYRVYSLERTATAPSKAGLIEQARLYVLVDGRSSLEAFSELVESLVAAKVDVIQLRDKGLDDRELLERARRLREITRATSTLFIMNDRPDLAVLAAADGVHVGQEELSVSDARRIVGPRTLVGVSTHSLDQARQAVVDGADYLGVGPTFASGTKCFDAHQLTGLALLRAVAAEIRLPAFAIGGIDGDNLPQVLAAGFTRVAVSGAILSAPDPASEARRLREKL